MSPQGEQVELSSYQLPAFLQSSDSSANSDNTAVSSGASPCWEPDGSFHVVCSVVISVGVFVAVISVACIFQIVKLCLKLKRDKETELSLKTYRLHANSAMVSAADAEGPPGRPPVLVVSAPTPPATTATEAARWQLRGADDITTVEETSFTTTAAVEEAEYLV